MIYSVPAPLFERRPYEELDTEGQAMWQLVNQLTGQATHVEVLAQHPALEDFYMNEFYPRFFYNSRGDMLVDTRDKELFRFRKGRMNGCAICNAGNSKTMLEAGYSTEQIEHILDPSPEYFSDRELAIIEFADLFVLGNTQPLTRPLHTRLRQYYSDAQILEFGVLAAFFMGWQRMLFAFDLAPHEGACELPNSKKQTAG